MSAAPVVGKMRRFSLTVASGPLKGKVFHFATPSVTVGRGPSNDIVIESDPQMSRSHMGIRQQNGIISIYNLTEKNAVFVNGQPVKAVSVEGTARLLIGSTEFLLQMDHPLPNISQSHIQSQVYRFSPVNSQKEPNIFIYILVGLVVIAVSFLISKNIIRHEEPKQLRFPEDVEQTEGMAKKPKTQDGETLTYQLAQEQFIKGYRDFHQGQYNRAIRELNTAIVYNPKHEIAHRYLAMARKKLDEIVRAELELGRKYRAQQSFRMCVASFKKVLTLLDDPENQTSREARDLLEECELQQREKY